MEKRQASHIRKPPSELVEFVETFLLRDHLISAIDPKEDGPRVRRKI
jgi:hypothetical protein